MSAGVKTFEKEQFSALQLLAEMNPAYWEYYMKDALNKALADGTIQAHIREVKAWRTKLMRWQLILPPVHSLPLYSNPTGSGYWIDVSETGHRSPKIVGFVGRSLEEWLRAAYRNLDSLLEKTNELLQKCKLVETLTNRDVLFVLDPPLEQEDERITVLRRFEHNHFLDMSAAQILNVFLSNSGLLTMRESERYLAAYILEGIRIGLKLEPADLDNVEYQLSTGDPQKWKKKGSSKNQLNNDIVTAAGRIGSSHAQMDPIKQSLIDDLRSADKVRAAKVDTKQ